MEPPIGAEHVRRDAWVETRIRARTGHGRAIVLWDRVRVKRGQTFMSSLHALVHLGKQLVEPHDVYDAISDLMRVRPRVRAARRAGGREPEPVSRKRLASVDQRHVACRVVTDHGSIDKRLSIPNQLDPRRTVDHMLDCCDEIKKPVRVSNVLQPLESIRMIPVCTLATRAVCGSLV